MPLEEIAKALIIYGPLGIFCVIAMYVANQKDKALAALQKEYIEKFEELQKQCQKEMQEFQERYILKSETWQTKYHELADSMQGVIKALQALHER